MKSPKTTSLSVESNHVATVFKALGSTTRLAILNFLIANPNSNCMKIVEAMPHAQSTVSKHLSELKTAKIIISTLDESVLMYQINKDFISLVQNFVTTIDSHLSPPVVIVEKASVKPNHFVYRKNSALKEFNYVFKKNERNQI